MVKIRKPIKEHLKILSILNKLIEKDNNSLGLSKILNKDQSTINIHLKYLFEELYIKRSDTTTRTYQVNWIKIIKEFIIFLDFKLKDELNQEEQEQYSKSDWWFPLWEKENEFIIIILKKVMFQDGLNTLNEVFEECFKIILNYKFEDYNIDEKSNIIDNSRLWWVYKEERKDLNLFVILIEDIQRVYGSSKLKIEIEEIINVKIESESKYSVYEAHSLVQDNQLSTKKKADELIKGFEEKYLDKKS